MTDLQRQLRTPQDIFLLEERGWISLTISADRISVSLKQYLQLCPNGQQYLQSRQPYLNLFHFLSYIKMQSHSNIIYLIVRCKLLSEESYLSEQLLSTKVPKCLHHSNMKTQQILRLFEQYQHHEKQIRSIFQAQPSTCSWICNEPGNNNCTYKILLSLLLLRQRRTANQLRTLYHYIQFILRLLILSFDGLDSRQQMRN